MVGKIKLPGRWSLRSPKRNKKLGTNEVFEVENLKSTTLATPDLDPEGNPASSPPKLFQLASPRLAPNPGRGLSKLPPHSEGVLPSTKPDVRAERIGRGGSASPLLRLRNLAKTFNNQKDRREELGANHDMLPPPGSDWSKNPKLRQHRRSISNQMEYKSQKSKHNQVVGSFLALNLHSHRSAEGDGRVREESKHTSGTFRDVQLDENNDATLRGKMDGQQLPRISFVGVFLNGVAVALATFTPVGGADARQLVKALLLEPSSPILPDNRYTASKSALAVHMVVDHKNRVYACVTAEDVPLSLAFGLLEEIHIQYLFNVSAVAFSTKENSHNNLCRAQMARTLAKYEAIEKILAQERETRRKLGEAPLDIESPSISKDKKNDTGTEVTSLVFHSEHETAALDATCEVLVRAPTIDSTCYGFRVGRVRGPMVVRVVVGLIVVCAAAWTAQHFYFANK